MTAPTFTCDRCGKSRTTSYAATSVIHRTLCLDCVHAVRRDIDQFAGEGADSSDTRENAAKDAGSPSPDGGADPPIAAPSFVDQVRSEADAVEKSWPVPVAAVRRANVIRKAADRIEELTADYDRMAEVNVDVLRERDLALDRIEELEAENAQQAVAMRIASYHDGFQCTADRVKAELRAEELEAELERTRQAWVNGDDPNCEDVCLTECKGPCEGTDRPVDLASDDRLIPLPGGRIAVAAQDLRVGDVVGGKQITFMELGQENNADVVAVRFDGMGTNFYFYVGTLVLLDKAEP